MVAQYRSWAREFPGPPDVPADPPHRPDDEPLMPMDPPERDEPPLTLPPLIDVPMPAPA